MITNLENIREPKGRPIEPKTAKPLFASFEGSKEWANYETQKRDFDKRCAVYEQEKQIIVSVNKAKNEIWNVFSKGNEDKDSILKAFEEKGIQVEETLIEDYLKEKAEQKINEKSAREVLNRLNYNSVHNNSSGIDYMNDILKAEVRLENASKTSYEFSKKIDDAATKIALDKKGINAPITDVNEAIIKLEALQELGYNGDLGTLAPIKIMNDQIKSYESKLKTMSQKLENQDKEISELKSENEHISKSNSEKDMENKSLKEENELKDSKINELKSKSVWKVFSEKVLSRFKRSNVKSLPSPDNNSKDEIKVKNTMTEQLKKSVNVDSNSERNTYTREVTKEDKSR